MLLPQHLRPNQHPGQPLWIIGATGVQHRNGDEGHSATIAHCTVATQETFARVVVGVDPSGGNKQDARHGQPALDELLTPNYVADPDRLRPSLRWLRTRQRAGATIASVTIRVPATVPQSVPGNPADLEDGA